MREKLRRQKPIIWNDYDLQIMRKDKGGRIGMSLKEIICEILLENKRKIYWYLTIFAVLSICVAGGRAITTQDSFGVRLENDKNIV